MLAPRRVPPCLTTSVEASNSAHERHRARRHAHGGADDVVLGTQPREAEAGAAARLVHQGHGPEGVVDAGLAVGQGVVHRKDEAGGELAQGTTRVHERGRVGHEHALGHEVEERLGQGLDRTFGCAVLPVRFRYGTSDTPEQGCGRFDRLAGFVAQEVALLEHRDGVRRQTNLVPWRGPVHRH